MRICIDSSTLIFGLQRDNPFAAQLLDLIGPEFVLVIPRLVGQEVTRNLTTPLQVRRFYRLFQARAFAFLVDEPVPQELVDKYIQLGLREKADAFIGAFAEWMQARYLISENRHFLREFKAGAFEVLSAEEFIARWEQHNL
jgi:predicted nucleic acid-binding protein